MTEPTIDPTLKALVDAFPMTFKVTDGVEVARAKLRQLQAPPGNAAGSAHREPHRRAR